jgi:hypothetical protein
MTGAARPAEVAEFVFFARDPLDLRDTDRRISLSGEDLRLINPNTLTCPIFRSVRDAEIVKGIYRRIPILAEDQAPAGQDTWPVFFRQGMFNMTTDAGQFRTVAQLGASYTPAGDGALEHDGDRLVPLLEGKLTEAYNHRYATFEGVGESDLARGYPRESTQTELSRAEYAIEPRYWVEAGAVEANSWLTSGLLTFHGIANPNNEDTAVFTVVPPVGIGHSLLLMLGLDARSSLLMCVIGNSLVLDYLVRVKSGSRNLSFFVVKQLPVPPFSALLRWLPSVIPAALELTYTAVDLRSFARDVGWEGPPFRWDEGRRLSLRSELEAIAFHLFGMSRDEVEYVVDQFPITRRREEADLGEYRTRRLILERFDAIAAAVAAAIEYRIPLDPPPGDPRAAHPPHAGEEPGHWIPMPAIHAQEAQSAVGAWSAHAGAPSAKPNPTNSKRTAPEPMPSLFAADPALAWQPEAAVAPSEIVMGSRVRHRARGEGTVLSVRPSGTSTELLIQFDATGETWIVFGYGVLEFQQ